MGMSGGRKKEKMLSVTSKHKSKFKRSKLKCQVVKLPGWHMLLHL